MGSMHWTWDNERSDLALNAQLSFVKPHQPDKKRDVAFSIFKNLEYMILIQLNTVVDLWAQTYFYFGNASFHSSTFKRSSPSPSRTTIWTGICKVWWITTHITPARYRITSGRNKSPTTLCTPATATPPAPARIRCRVTDICICSIGAIIRVVLPSALKKI